MKIYVEYDVPDTGVPALNPLGEFTMKIMMEKNKYKIMWQLRSLENQINEEGGMIIITEKGRIHTKNFTPDLTDRILELLRLDEQ